LPTRKFSGVSALKYSPRASMSSGESVQVTFSMAMERPEQNFLYGMEFARSLSKSSKKPCTRIEFTRHSVAIFEMRPATCGLGAVESVMS